MKTVIFGLFGLGGLLGFVSIGSGFREKSRSALMGSYLSNQSTELQVFKKRDEFLLVGSLEFQRLHVKFNGDIGPYGC